MGGVVEVIHPIWIRIHGIQTQIHIQSALCVCTDENDWTKWVIQ